MIEAEFNSWLEAHMAAFPGMISWAEKLKKLGHWNAVRSSWLRVMGDVEVNDALRVTEDLARGDMAIKNAKSFGDHAREIRAVCKGMASRRKHHSRKMIDGQPTIGCLECQDCGVTSIFSVDSMRDEANGTLDRNDWYLHTRARSLAVRCTCEEGQCRTFPPLQFDPAKMVSTRGMSAEAFDRLADFIAEWKRRVGERLFQPTEF